MDEILCGPLRMIASPAPRLLFDWIAPNSCEVSPLKLLMDRIAAISCEANSKFVGGLGRPEVLLVEMEDHLLH